MTKVHIIACGALAREIRAVCALGGLEHVRLSCLPAIWHNHPDRIVPGVEKAIAAARADGAERLFVAYGDCGTGGGLDALLEREGVERIPGAHCYAFFSGVEAFAKRAEDDMTSFFLTDFLARQFEAFVIEPLGLDRHPELREAYFGHYRKLVYLAQTDDAALTAQAQAAADRLGLAFERRFTGYGDLAVSLIGVPPSNDDTARGKRPSRN